MHLPVVPKVRALLHSSVVLLLALLLAPACTADLATESLATASIAKTSDPAQPERMPQCVVVPTIKRPATTQFFKQVTSVWAPGGIELTSQEEASKIQQQYRQWASQESPDLQGQHTTLEHFFGYQTIINETTAGETGTSGTRQQRVACGLHNGSALQSNSATTTGENGSPSVAEASPQVYRYENGTDKTNFSPPYGDWQQTINILWLYFPTGEKAYHTHMDWTRAYLEDSLDPTPHCDRFGAGDFDCRYTSRQHSSTLKLRQLGATTVANQMGTGAPGPALQKAIASANVVILETADRKPSPVMTSLFTWLRTNPLALQESPRVLYTPTCGTPVQNMIGNQTNTDVIHQGGPCTFASFRAPAYLVDGLASLETWQQILGRFQTKAIQQSEVTVLGYVVQEAKNTLPPLQEASTWNVLGFRPMPGRPSNPYSPVPFDTPYQVAYGFRNR